MPDAVLFDLDGTLADTAPDLCATLNICCLRKVEPQQPFSRLRPHTSSGVRGMLGEGFGIEPADAEYGRLSARFLEIYGARLCEMSTLFDGIAELLDTLEAHGIAWGIVTNKRARFTDPLVAALGLSPRTACVVSGDTTAEAKPSPLPVLHACTMLGCATATHALRRRRPARHRRRPGGRHADGSGFLRLSWKRRPAAYLGRGLCCRPSGGPRRLPVYFRRAEISRLRGVSRRSQKRPRLTEYPSFSSRTARSSASQTSSGRRKAWRTIDKRMTSR